MSEDEELSEDELNALLSDLESRSDGGGGGGGDLEGGGPEDEDLEAFLQQAEQEESGSGGGETTVKQRGGAEAGPDLSDLEMGDDLPAEAGGSKVAEASSERGGEVAEGDADEEKAKGSGSGGGNGLAIAGLVAKWAAYSLPVIALWWVVGAYLGQWISAGWLILLVATTFVAGVPFGLYRVSNNRGRFRWWMAGVSLVLTVGLVAPLTGPASRALTHFGHWPATAIAEVTGSAANSGEPEGLLVETVGSVGAWIGGQLNPELPPEESSRRLGSREPASGGE